MLVARLLLLPIIAAVGACTGVTDGAEQHAVPSEALPVRTASASSVSGGTALSVTGTVRARRETTLAFTTAGRIATLSIDEGDRVRAGQLLASLDRTQVGAAASAAQARARQAVADLRRLRTLFDSGWVTRARLDAAEAAAGTAQAELRAAAFDVGAATVSAPGAGIVLRRHVEPGQIVAAGAPIVTIAEADHGFVLRVPIADNDLRRISIGQPASLTIAALGTAPIRGTIIEIGARSDSGTGTFEAEIALPTIAGLRSGLIAEARIAVPSALGPGTVAVPPLALFSARAGEGFVYVAENGRARARLVAIGTVDDERVQIVRGLSPGEQVIVTGIERLRDGMPVRLVPR
jgi:RND family efflux transporter MFP subunit